MRTVLYTEREACEDGSSRVGYGQKIEVDGAGTAGLRMDVYADAKREALY